MTKDTDTNKRQFDEDSIDDDILYEDDYEYESQFSSYMDFAEVYDELMDETPYDLWCQRIVDILKADNIEEGLVLDLGCGTGTLTEMLADKGYDMTGIDLSGEMLSVAMKKREQSGNDILYLCQDMREFELYGTVKAVVCVCDSLNYILDEEELLTVFRLVNNYLDPKGLFIFDFNTVHKYQNVIGDSVIAENREDCSFIWENYYDSDTGINQYDITFFVRDKKNTLESNMFRRFEETHFQKGYDPDTVKVLLEKAGLVFEKAVDSDTMGLVTADSERIFVVARENGK